jgi:hypothetical protein
MTTDLQAYAEVAWEHIHYLAEVIGPRGSTTLKEREAAEYVRDILQALGIDAGLDTFQSERSTYRPFVLAFVAACLGTALYTVIRHPGTALVAALLNGLGAWGMFAELDFTLKGSSSCVF